METKSVQVNMKVRPSFKKAAEMAAADDNRSLTSYIEKVVIEDLKKRGYLPKQAK